jgi:two-component system LytT family response regulator
MMVSWHEIIHCIADSNYTKVILKDQSSFMVSKTLASVESILPSTQFIRVHQSHVIRLDLIRIIRTHELILVTGDTVPISRAGRKLIKGRLQECSQPV